MRPAPLTVLTNSFYAFYDLHRPAYRDYAAARLAPEEAQIAVAHLFDLVASHWSTIVREPDPTAWAWERHTQTIARRSGRALTLVEETLLLHEELRLSIDKIATVTGTEPAAVSTRLPAATPRTRNTDVKPSPADEGPQPLGRRACRVRWLVAAGCVRGALGDTRGWRGGRPQGTQARPRAGRGIAALRE